MRPILRLLSRVGDPKRVTHGADDVGDVRDCRAGRCSQVEDLGAGGHVDLVHTAQDSCRKLGPEGVPHPVLQLGLSFLKQK